MCLWRHIWGLFLCFFQLPFDRVFLKSIWSILEFVHFIFSILQQKRGLHSRHAITRKKKLLAVLASRSKTYKSNFKIVKIMNSETRFSLPYTGSIARGGPHKVFFLYLTTRWSFTYNWCSNSHVGLTRLRSSAKTMFLPMTNSTEMNMHIEHWCLIEVSWPFRLVDSIFTGLLLYS